MKKFILIIILVLASFLRLYQVDSLPALNADEAAIGYNAYSLLETGKDEHGNSWPINFQSFNDYKPGLYFYLDLPFVKTLGLNVLAVRLPGILLGIAAVFLLWLFVKSLFPERKWLPETAAALLAISPWHIHFSRGGWEVNAATFFVLLGICFFVNRKKGWNIYLSAVFFIVSLYTYHAERVVVPLLVLSLLLLERSRLIEKLRMYFLPALLSIVLVTPLVFSLLGSAGVSRASGVGLIADQGPVSKANEQRGEHEDFRGLLPKVLHNRFVNYSLEFGENYLKHFSGEFLFISGDEIQRNKVPETGQLYLLDLAFLVVGMFLVFKDLRGWGIIMCWLAIAPLASSFTFQSPHALRSQNMIIPLMVVSAYGVLGLSGLLGRIVKNKHILCTIYFVLFTIYLWDFTRYLHQYYFHLNKTYDYSSQYGIEELVSFVKYNYNNYSKFIVTTRYDQPYILFLFYLKYPPQKFQDSHNLTSLDEFGFSTVPQFDKFEFQKVDSLSELRKNNPGVLIAVAPDEYNGEGVVKIINFPNGNPAFYLIDNK